MKMVNFSLARLVLVSRALFAVLAISLFIILLVLLRDDVSLGVLLLAIFTGLALFIYSLVLLAASGFGWEDAQ